jgi:hypothetical protein
MSNLTAAGLTILLRSCCVTIPAADYAATSSGDAGLETPADESLLDFYDGIRRVAKLALKDCKEVSSALFDCYRSVADSDLMIFVAKDVVPPFRFKAGGWEFLQSSTELEPTIATRIAQNGYFMFRTNEAGRIELTDLTTHSPEAIAVPSADRTNEERRSGDSSLLNPREDSGCVEVSKYVAG